MKRLGNFFFFFHLQFLHQEKTVNLLSSTLNKRQNGNRAGVNVEVREKKTHYEYNTYQF